jgi:hypothetical protein
LWDVGGDGASQRDRQRVVSALSHRILENGTLVHQIAKIALHNSLELDGGEKKSQPRFALPRVSGAILPEEENSLLIRC